MAAIFDPPESVTRIEREGEVLRALTGERDRAVYELHKVRGELRRVSQHFDLLKDEHKGCGVKHKDSQRTLEGVEAEYQKLRAADTAKALESASTILEQRQSFADLKRRLSEVELQLQESVLAHRETERRLQSVLAQGSLRQQIETERSTVAALERQRAADAEVMARQGERIADLEGRLAAAQSAAQDLEGRHLVRMEGQAQQQQQMKNRFAAQQQQYRALLREGRQAALGAQRALELSLREHPTLYRSGTAGLLAWLESYHLESLHSCLINNGFTDFLSVMHITDEDLAAMKQTVGTRRKMLGATAALQSQFEAAPRGTEAATGPLEALEQWMRDFDAIIDAEESTK